VSPTGEIAVMIKTRNLRIPLGGSTLAIITPDGAPRPVAEQVYRAAFAPDGKSMAVLRVTGGRFVLEYPIGHQLYEAPFLDGPADFAGRTARRAFQRRSSAVQACHRRSQRPHHEDRRRGAQHRRLRLVTERGRDLLCMRRRR
jgi:hypothetical protein